MLMPITVAVAAYVNKGEYDRAIGDFNKAIQLKPDYAEAYHNLRIAYERRGQS